MIKYCTVIESPRVYDKYGAYIQLYILSKAMDKYVKFGAPTISTYYDILNRCWRTGMITRFADPYSIYTDLDPTFPTSFRSGPLSSEWMLHFQQQNYKFSLVFVWKKIIKCEKDNNFWERFLILFAKLECTFNLDPGSVFWIQIQIRQINEYGSFPDPDSQTLVLTAHVQSALSPFSHHICKILHVHCLHSEQSTNKCSLLRENQWV